MISSGIYGIFNKKGGSSANNLLDRSKFRFNWPDAWSEFAGNESVTLLFHPGKSIRVTAKKGDDTVSIIFSGRIDNRKELLKKCDVFLTDAECITDAELVLRVYQRWGEHAAQHFIGDWSFAVWHHQQKRLFLARDQIGVTGLFYYEDEQVFMFSSTKDFILESGMFSPELDELYLAQVILGWMAYHGEGTVYTQIKRLPPAHTISVTQSGTSIRQYWQPENVTPLILKNRHEYVEAFDEVFTEAVRCRIPDSGSVSISMSGGLDSSSIAAIAAGLLAKDSRRLTAYTSVPLSDSSCFLDKSTGDEWPRASSVARYLKNVDIHAVDARSISPIMGIKKILEITREPSHAACNYYWMLAIRELVRDADCKVLLSGQMGNGTISWRGDLFSQSDYYIIKKIGVMGYIKGKISPFLPYSVARAYHRKLSHNDRWLRTTAINHNLAQRLNVIEARLDEEPARTAIQKRAFFKPGKLNIGAQQAEISAMYGHELRDPTADPRVMDFTFAVPDRIYIHPETDTDRWLIREAMKGRVPDDVRLNTVFGRQAADQVLRLRSTSDEVDRTLVALAAGPASGYLDVDYMQQTWAEIQHIDSPAMLKKAGSILLRGIMAGLFVNKFYGYGSE